MRELIQKQLIEKPPFDNVGLAGVSEPLRCMRPTDLRAIYI